MNKPFDFLNGFPRYSDNAATLDRLNNRHRLLIDPFLPWIKNERVLDLACHDGRWSYAFAAAGAVEVVGVEARQELVDEFDTYPDTDFKTRVTLHCDDIFDALEDMVSRNEKFNVVAMFGIFYHIMDHYRLLKLIRRLKPKIIIVDSEFIMVENAMIQIIQEKTENPLNAAAEFPGQRRMTTGVPSRKAMEFMADTLDFDASWLKPGLILGEDEEHSGMSDYFRNGRKLRGVCALSPKSL